MAKRHYGKIERMKKGATRVVASVELRHTPTSLNTARPIPMRQEQKGGKRVDYETRSLQHGEILASSRGGSSYYSPARACKTKAGPPRRDQVELVFIPRNVPAGKHSKRPPQAGPALRFCTGAPGFGPMLPVKDPREAKKIAAAYQKCLREDPKKKQAACFEEATGQKVASSAFGSAPAKRRKAKRGFHGTVPFTFPWQRR